MDSPEWNWSSEGRAVAGNQGAGRPLPHIQGSILGCSANIISRTPVLERSGHIPAFCSRCLPNRTWPDYVRKARLTGDDCDGWCSGGWPEEASPEQLHMLRIAFPIFGLTLLDELVHDGQESDEYNPVAMRELISNSGHCLFAYPEPSLSMTKVPDCARRPADHDDRSLWIEDQHYNNH